MFTISNFKAFPADDPRKKFQLLSNSYVKSWVKLACWPMTVLLLFLNISAVANYIVLLLKLKHWLETFHITALFQYMLVSFRVYIGVSGLMI